MRHLLCFGDSNTWGYVPASGQRFRHDVRWPGVLQARLGGGYRQRQRRRVGIHIIFGLSSTERLEKGGPIAIADYTILNNGDPADTCTELERILKMLNLRP